MAELPISPRRRRSHPPRPHHRQGAGRRARPRGRLHPPVHAPPRPRRPGHRAAAGAVPGGLAARRSAAGRAPRGHRRRRRPALHRCLRGQRVRGAVRRARGNRARTGRRAHRLRAAAIAGRAVHRLRRPRPGHHDPRPQRAVVRRRRRRSGRDRRAPGLRRGGGDRRARVGGHGAAGRDERPRRRARADVADRRRRAGRRAPGAARPRRRRGGRPGRRGAPRHAPRPCRGLQLHVRVPRRRRVHPGGDGDPSRAGGGRGAHQPRARRGGRRGRGGAVAREPVQVRPDVRAAARRSAADGAGRHADPRRPRRGRPGHLRPSRSRRG